MLRKTKILIVEDDFILYDELAEFFSAKGFSIAGHSEDRAVDNYEDAVAVLKAQQPDIAILDINIKGDKDGIELGAHIRDRYNIPVIFLSAYNNFENLERIRNSGNDKFVVKASKPLNKEQLWATFELALPGKKPTVNKEIPTSMGNFFCVKEVAVKKNAKANPVDAGREEDVLEIETFLKWNDITFIESYNAARSSGNNNVLIHLVAPDKAYLMRSSLANLEKLLPPYFARFDQSTIVNLHKVEARNKTRSRYIIGDYTFAMSDGYKKTAQKKIDDWLSGFPVNIPES